jgi:ribonucleotide reductase alpha subunit
MIPVQQPLKEPQQLAAGTDLHQLHGLELRQRLQDWLDAMSDRLNLAVPHPVGRNTPARRQNQPARRRASGKKLDETYKLAWLRGLKTTYYLRTMGATHAEKSTVHKGSLNAVPAAEEGSQLKVCSIDDPECEACQ